MTRSKYIFQAHALFSVINSILFSPFCTMSYYTLHSPSPSLFSLHMCSPINRKWSRCLGLLLRGRDLLAWLFQLELIILTFSDETSQIRLRPFYRERWLYVRKMFMSGIWKSGRKRKNKNSLHTFSSLNTDYDFHLNTENSTLIGMGNPMFIQLHSFESKFFFHLFRRLSRTNRTKKTGCLLFTLYFSTQINIHYAQSK